MWIYELLIRGTPFRHNISMDFAEVEIVSMICIPMTKDIDQRTSTAVATADELHNGPRRLAYCWSIYVFR